MRKMDEMEQNINLKGIKWSWFFMVISLFIWGVYDYVKTQSASLPLFLFSMQFLIYFFVTNIAKWKAGDEDVKKQFIWYFGGVFIFVIIFGIILYSITGR